VQVGELVTSRRSKSNVVVVVVVVVVEGDGVCGCVVLMSYKRKLPIKVLV
jgi:hypothetical protein